MIFNMGPKDFCDCHAIALGQHLATLRPAIVAVMMQATNGRLVWTSIGTITVEAVAMLTTTPPTKGPLDGTRPNRDRTGPDHPPTMTPAELLGAP